jgi:NADH-quinone oxidoreductase subunit G
LDDAAAVTYHAAPDEIARLGFAVAHEVSRVAPRVDELSDELDSTAVIIAQALMNARRPIVVAGITSDEKPLLHAAANVAWALHSIGRHVQLCFTMPECNSFGVALMGGMALEEAFAHARGDRAATVFILENDLFRRAPSHEVTEFLSSYANVVLLDQLSNGCTPWADLVLPAGTFAEADGTLVSSEGRASRFYQVFQPANPIQESWRWVRDTMSLLGHDEAAGWQGLDSITAAMAERLPGFGPIGSIAPDATFRAVGQKIPRQAHRSSGRTAVTANISVHEPAPPADPDSALAFSMEGYQGIPPSSLLPRFWAPGWNSVQALYRFQQRVYGPLRGGDPGRRMIEPSESAKPEYFTDVPGSFQPRGREWLVVPAFHIFGSEELSVLSPGIAERVPRPYLGLGPQDAGTLGLKEGEEATLMIGVTVLTLPVQVHPTLPPGVASLPVGLPGVECIVLPAWGRVVRAGPISEDAGG